MALAEDLLEVSSSDIYTLRVDVGLDVDNARRYLRLQKIERALNPAINEVTAEAVGECLRAIVLMDLRRYRL